MLNNNIDKYLKPLNHIQLFHRATRGRLEQLFYR